MKRRPHGSKGGMGMQSAFDPANGYTKAIRELFPYEVWDLTRKEVPPKKKRLRKPPEPWEFTEENKQGE